MATNDIHTLFLPPQICEYIASFGKRDLADVANIKQLEMDHPRGPNLATGIFKSISNCSERRDHRRIGFSGFEGEGREPQTGI